MRRIDLARGVVVLRPGRGERFTRRSIRPRRCLLRPVPSYRLISAEGDDLGSLRAAAPDWREGDRIHRGAGDLLVVRLVEAEPDDEVDGYLVVQPAP